MAQVFPYTLHPIPNSLFVSEYSCADFNNVANFQDLRLAQYLVVDEDAVLRACVADMVTAAFVDNLCMHA
jgi:hypothetical protein